MSGRMILEDYTVQIWEPYRRGKRYIATFHYQMLGNWDTGQEEVTLALLSGPADQTKSSGYYPLAVDDDRADITFRPMHGLARNHGFKPQSVTHKGKTWDLGDGLIVKHHKLGKAIRKAGQAGVTELSRDQLKAVIRELPSHSGT